MASVQRILKERSQERLKIRSITKGPLLAVSEPGQIEVIEDASDPTTKQLKRILSGRIGDLPPVSSKTVRVFLSSTFSDMICERNALMEHTYPKLKDFCRKHGLEFQVVDMRWGIREEAQDDHMTSVLCMKEIQKCQRISVGPAFVVIFGQKYGYRPFPEHIPVNEFEGFLKSLKEDGKDVKILEKWYKKDENVIPPVYSLIPISTYYPDFVNKREPELQEIDRGKWWEVFEQLQRLLRQAASVCYRQKTINKEQKEKYFMSVTEDEIRNGIMFDKIKNRTVVMHRNVEDLLDHLNHSRAMKFIDMLPGPEKKVDTEAQTMLHRLKNDSIPKEVKSEHITSFDIKWSNNNGINERDHLQYLLELCGRFYDMLKKQIQECLAKMDDLSKDPRVLEVMQHSSTCENRCELFQGRDDALDWIKCYTLGGSNQPMTVFGESGSGKTSLMAKVAKLVPTWYPQNINPVVVTRLLGTTASSSGIFSVLQCMCYQIAFNYNVDFEAGQDDMNLLVAKFWDILKVATQDKPLVIILDSLDQLSPNNHAHRLNWLPWQLPPQVRLIVSVLKSEQRILGKLQEMTHSQANFLEVNPLGTNQSYAIIKQWLAKEKRTTTKMQEGVVKIALAACSLPLFTKLVFEDIKRWRSYHPLEQTHLEHTVTGTINKLFDKIEIQHGQLLVSHALSYIAAARSGLSEVELEDVLSLDDKVLDEIFTFWVPPIRRIPPLLWTRIRDDLSAYIVERGADGITVLAWYHRQFIEVTNERYFSNKEFKMRVHSILADYFTGKWSGQKKPFRYSDVLVKSLSVKANSEADRKIPRQPLKWKYETPKGIQVHYNIRKLNELPYHLAKSGREQELWKEVFYNYKWLHTKVKACGVSQVLSDFALVHSNQMGQMMVLLASVLRVAGSSLRHLPNTLAAELLGRLRPYAKSNDLIASLANQCHSAGLRHCSLLPAFQCFDAPLEALLFALEGHSGHITDIAFNSDGSQLFSVSEDGKLMSWDVKTGEYLFCRDVSDSKVSKHSEIQITESGRLVLENYTERSVLKVFTATTGMFLHDVTERKPGFIHNTIVTRNFALREGELADIRNGQIKAKIDRLCQQQSFVTVAVTHNEKYLLIGHSDETEMIELLTGKLVKKFANRTSPSHTEIIRPSQMVITDDDRTLVTGFSVDCLVTVINIDPSSSQFGQVSFEFDYQSGFPDQQFIESSQYSQEVRELYISPDQKLALANVKRCHLFVIDLATGNTKMLNTGVFEGSGMIFHESRFLQDSKSVAAIYGNNLCMWSVSDGRLESHLRLIGCEEDHYILASCPAQNIVATVSSQEKSIKVYDLDKLKGTEVPSVHVYNNPVDCIAVSAQKKLAFVKTYRKLNTHRGYHFTEYFGIDVWNLSTNYWQHFLPWGKYGQLIQIEVSLDGQYLILVTQNKMVSTVFVIDIARGEIKKKLNLRECTHVVLSPDSEHLLVECKGENNAKDVHLWDLNESTAGITFPNSRNPLFSFDSKRVVCISEKRIMSYCTVTQKQEFLMLKKIIPYEIKAIPNRPHTVALSGLTTGGTLMKKGVKLELWNLMSRNRSSKIDGISPAGIIDTSKDGHIAVDSYLQVFDFVSGKVILQCDKQGAINAQERPLVRLTYDGQYVIWADTKPAECVKVMKVSDGQLVAEVSTHSKVVSLTVADYGYLVVVGTNDGHLLTFRLHRITAQDDEDDERISLSGTLDRRNISQISPQINGTLYKSRKKLSEGNLFNLLGNGRDSPDCRRKSAGSLSLYSISSVSASGYSTLPKNMGSQMGSMHRSNSNPQLNEEVPGIHPVDLQRLDLLFQEEEDSLSDKDLPVAGSDIRSQLEEGAWFSHGGNYDYQTSLEKKKLKRSGACVIV